MNDFKGLIAELGAAKEGSRGLSDKVLLACGWVYDERRPAGRGHTGWYLPDGEALFTTHTHLFGAPSPTESLDAALTLVPEGFAINDFMIWPGHPASLTIFGTHKDGDKYWHNASDGRWKGEAATPPLAVSVAALKARE